LSYDNTIHKQKQPPAGDGVTNRGPNPEKHIGGAIMAKNTVSTNGGKGKRSTWKRLRNSFYRWLLHGKSGTLANGVRWRIEYPKAEQDKQLIKLKMAFADPQATDFISEGYFMWNFLNTEALEEIYLWGLKEYAERLARYNLESTDRDDPDGFFVRWKRA
jgi:hypothetical protein